MAIVNNKVLRRVLASLFSLCTVLLLVLPAGSLASTDVLRVRAVKGGVSLRTQPYEDAPKIRGIHSDYVLDVYDERNGWYYVSYKGDRGWVTGSRVTVVERRGSSGSSSAGSSSGRSSAYGSTPTPRPASVRPSGSGGFRSFSGFANIAARPNRKLATRTGPATRYDEPGTYAQDTQVRAMSKAYDSGNGIWWIQFQMRYRGQVYCLYTGLKRFDGLDISQLPTEKVIGRCRLSMSAEAYYAPCEDAARNSWDVPANTQCDIYAVVTGSGSDYIQVEFYDSVHGTWRRAWIKEWYADEEYFY